MLTTRRILCFCLAVLTVFSLWGCASTSPGEETSPATTDAVVETTEATEPIIEGASPQETEETTPVRVIPTTPDGEPILATFHIKNKSLNARSSPNMSSRILDCLQKGKEVKILDVAGSGQWVKIYFTDYNGIDRIGYCFNNDSYFLEGKFDKNVDYYAVIDESEETVEATEPVATETVSDETKPVEETKPKVEESTKPTEEATTPTETAPPAVETQPEETAPLETIAPTEATEPATEPAVENDTPDPEKLAMENHGNYGRLVIPAIDVSCQLNSIDLNSSEASYLAQYYTDMEDSAAFFMHNKIYVISDHSYQSFERLEEIQARDKSCAYIGNEDGVKTYYCYKACYGRNESGRLKTDSGTDATSYDGVVMYTFSNTKSGCDIFLTFWREKTW